MAATAQDPSAPLRGGEKLKDEDQEATEYSPFYGIEKGAVLQDARIFHSSQIDARRCQQVITKLLYLLHQGETFTKKEASEVFFAVTKLFQNKDANLRRMVYLCIREIMPQSDEVIIVISSLMKDMNSNVDLYRSNGIRVLSHIVDTQLLAQIERYLKQAVVDKSPVVASAALVSGMHLYAASPDIIKRWSSEIQEATASKHAMVQYHAVCLLHAIRSSDRLAVSKLVATLTKSSVQSPLAQCMLVRCVAQVIADSQPGGDGTARPFYDFLESCLRHKAEVVIFQAARAITDLKDVTLRELTPAVTVLQLFLSSSKPILRFAAVRTLNRVAMKNPTVVANCNIDMEGLISDSNRSIATLAITTLLKTGNESSVERLLKQIGSFMSDIADDFKIVVVQAIRSLCLKFPQKHRSLMTFLSNMLREEGGFEYKKAIVDSILLLIQDIPDAKEAGLMHLCEFIEDCEFTYLSVQVLHLLGSQGPSTSDPAKYIRYIYNRIILENATVRAAAVSSLAKFAVQVPQLRERIVVLLRRALNDIDDEVRDRATFSLKELESDASLLATKFDIPASNLEAALKEYLAGPTTEPFDLNMVSRTVPEAQLANGRTPAGAGRAASAAAPTSARANDASESEQAAELVKSLPQFAHLGALFKTCEAIQLTEEGTEYNVHVVKHIFESHAVLQYNCTNTIKEQVLEDVSVIVDLAEAEDFEEESTVPLQSMPLNAVGHTFVVLRRASDAMAVGKLANILKFKVKEVDLSTGDVEAGGFDDEYQLEDLDITAADYIKRTPCLNFKKAWDGLDPATEIADDYGLGEREGLQEAIEAVLDTLGMQTCEGSDAVPPGARSHTVLLSGTFLGDVQVLAKVSFGIDATQNVAMKLIVRAEDASVSEAVHAAIQNA